MTTVLAKQKLAEVRAHSRQGLKSAAIGGEPESSFESSLASLAYIYIRDKAPALLDYMVGFQLVDRNEDNTKAVGIFGFKLDNQWLYAPVFFLNGDLKGHELLYLKDQDTFVPMKENWINYLISKQPMILGKSSPDTARDLGIQQPNLSALSTPPETGKFAADKYLPKLQKWAYELLPRFAQWCCKSPSKLEKFAGLPERLDLATVLASDVRIVKTAVELFKKSPGLKQAFDTYYGDATLTTALHKLRNQILAQPSGILQQKQAAATKPKKVEIVADDVITENLPEMTEPEREKLLRDGYLIRDHRNGEEVSKAYNVQIPQTLSNPDQTDIYEVLSSEGEFDKCVVIHNPHGGRGRVNSTLVLRLSDKQWGTYDATAVFVRPAKTEKQQVESFQDWLDGQSGAESLQTGATYVAIADNGHGSAVFEVEEDLGDKFYSVYWPYGDYSRTSRPSYLPDAAYAGSGESCDQVVLNQRQGTSFKSFHGKLFVPPNAKIIKIKDAPKCTKCDKTKATCNCDYFNSPRKDFNKQPIKPGNLADLQMQIFQKTAEVKLWHDHNEVVINRSRMTKKAGLMHLVRDHGFTERTAKRMLKEAERAGGKRYRVKYANPYPYQYDAMQGPGVPSFPEQDMMAAAPEYGNVPATMPQEDSIGIPEMDAAMTDPGVYDNSPQALPDPAAMQTAQTAAQTGQKEVFDASMIGGLLKAVRDDSLVDRYQGDLMKALDRLGRIYFLFLWHNDEFMERYGKSDLPELEDALRNSFEGLGDLVLFLRAKSVSPLEGTGELGEPNIDGAALN